MANEKDNVKGYFLISVNTDNKLENKDIIELILGKRILESVENTGVEGLKKVNKIPYFTSE